MAILSEDQQERIKGALYRKYGTCYNCMPYEGGEPVWIVPSSELDEGVEEAIVTSDVYEEIENDPDEMIDEIISELQLSCPNCGTGWGEKWIEIGRHLAPPLEKITLQVPTINDDPHDFDLLFWLWGQVNGDYLDVEFNFTWCRFLRQNAVAFLGGLARLIEYRGGIARFNWETLQDNIRTNLVQNGFMSYFGEGRGHWTGNSIPYRQCLRKDKESIMGYLKWKWLGRGWVNVSAALRNAIVGTVWEIFENAFEHGISPIGVFCCGQHYPQLHLLKLCVLDFGVGIPSSVRWFKKKEAVSAAGAIKWAFMPGTTTKPNGMGRGMGLDLLKEFVKLNQGELEIYSHEGYALIKDAREKYLDRFTFFEGTIVNITFKCDEAYYHFASEEKDEKLF